MIVRRLELAGFMSHVLTEVALPARGITLVTGHNGAGKSSIVEAVAVGLWGKTLRGAKPWSGDGMVVVRTEDVRAARHHAKDKTKLEWGKAPLHLVEKYDSTTKAQAGLERLVGPFDLWRRTCVFSSQDAAHFTLATDGERKRLLETLLGLDKFDAAAAACRTDLRDATRVHERATARLETAKAERERAEHVLAEAEGELPPAPDLAAAQRAEALATQERDDLDEECQDARKITRRAEAALTSVQTELYALRRRIEKTSAESCPTCERPFPEAERRAALAELARAQTQYEAAEAAAHDAEQAATRLHQRASVALREAQGRVDEARVALVEARAAERVRAQAAKAVTNAEAALAMRAAEEGVAMIEASLAGQVLLELAATERVLALTGVRAQLLSGALGGIEAVANAWLGRIAGWGLRLELKPYAETASGAKDAISLEVHGAGGGHGYRAASGGERRRIDVALLLALAEVGGAASGAAPGTVFFDEVFDALDADGIDAVCGVLEELAADRPVVLISHSRELIERLRPDVVAQHLVVGAGKVELASPSEADSAAADV